MQSYKICNVRNLIRIYAALPSGLAQATKLMCAGIFLQNAPPSFSAISSYTFSDATRLSLRDSPFVVRTNTKPSLLLAPMRQNFFRTTAHQQLPCSCRTPPLASPAATFQLLQRLTLAFASRSTNGRPSVLRLLAKSLTLPRCSKIAQKKKTAATKLPEKISKKRPALAH